MKIKTTFLKIILLGMSVFILFVAMLWTFGFIHAYSANELYPARIIAHISLYGTAISSLSIIFFVYRILRLIDQSNPFSTQALQLIRKIKQATLVIFVLFWFGNCCGSFSTIGICSNYRKIIRKRHSNQA
jgi:hypothetical protein